MDGIVGTITGIIGSFLYRLIGSVFLWVINVVDGIFRALAGMGDNYSFSGASSGTDVLSDSGGIIYELLKTDVIKKLILSIMILAGFLLIVFTVMAFLKNMYAPKQKPAKEIISNSIKGLLYFFFVPVCTLFGICLGNIVLKAVDGATSLGKSTRMSGKLFVTCAYNANMYRTGKTPDAETIQKLKEFAKQFGYANSENIPESMSSGEFANLIDDVFATSPNASYDNGYVEEFYDLYNFNHILMVVGGIFMLYVLCSLAFAMARRIFIMLIWFVISPACCAMFPLDEGKMVGKYKDEMTKQVLSAYGAVAGINLFMSVMPLIERIKISVPGGDSSFINLFIQICGLLCVKELVSSLSSLVGGEDALGKGSSLMKSSTGAMKKYVGGAVKKTATGAGKFMGNVKTHGWVGGFGKSVGQGALGLGNMLTKTFAGVDVKDTIKTFKDSKKGQQSSNREDMQKDTKNAWLKKLNPANLSGENISKLISEGASHFASADDVYEELAKKNKGVSETDLRERVREAEKDKATIDKTHATYAAPLGNAHSDFLEAQSNLSAAGAAEVKANKDLNDLGKTALTNLDNVINTEGKQSSRKQHMYVESARGTLSNMQDDVKNGDYAKALSKASTIKIDKINDSAFKEQLNAFMESLRQATEAQKVATEATRERVEAESVVKTTGTALAGVLSGVKESLGSLGSKIVTSTDDLGKLGDSCKEAKKILGMTKEDKK